ncbi:M14 family zinc carboxypeptidase [Natronococcus jeotgali]|uniref:Peptidase M14 carboxypeptidase A n=1 Tax=Natronococcus jeotgali DSM 18795 TaxID=1227498 RepID=L9X453_9EURY|nr:M14 family zinc carboxypeptidase [Natronococcus jeotgali]ELY56402.1 peptidase M14 carboxypeptidase A [Natronococcus jeotgali DSM 18795]
MSTHDQHHDEAEPTDDRTEYTAEEAADLEADAFDGGGIDRRTFLSVAAATGAALALPTTVSADVTDDALTDVAEFAVNATDEDYEATLVLEFADGDALGAFYDEFGEPDWEIDEDDRAPKVVYREAPTPAAHARLTAAELEAALEDGGIEHVDFSPGANPFWKLDDPYGDYEVYPEYVEEYDVFPSVESARDFVSHGEVGWALEHLEAEHPDMVNLERIGYGPGHENHVTGEDPDLGEIYVAELTNDVQDREAFAEKDKAVFTVAIHGNEQAGREAASRILENAAKGESEAFNPLLDDIAIVYVYINPDGWLVREPHVGGSADDPTINHERGNSTGLDTNRQYPTIGWVDPAFWPAEPADDPGIRPGYDVGYEDMVPDALAAVEHLRGYDNVEYLCDYHMMGWADSMVLNLESNATYEHDGTHNLDEVNRRINDAMTDRWGGPEAIAEDTIRAGRDTADHEEYVPETLQNYGSIYDSLEYNITGGLLGWAGIEEERGGLGAVTVAPELGLRDFQNWRPYVERHLETAYFLSMREFAELCAADTDATVATDDSDVAYVRSETLTRSSADLSHTPDDGSPGKGKGKGKGESENGSHGAASGDGGTEVRCRADRLGAEPTPVDVTENTQTVSVCFLGGGEDGVVRLCDPDGEPVREIDLSEHDADDCCMTDPSSLFFSTPDAGEWTLQYDGDGELAVEIVVVDSDEEHPDPEVVLGYSQQDYEVNPLAFFEDLDPFLEDGSIEGISVHHVGVGRLLKGNSGKRHYDELVIAHDDGIDDPDYVAAIEAFVEAGGDLVLTDTGLYLLDVLEVGDAADLSAADIASTTITIANLEDRNFDHHLLTDLREIQREIWKSPQIGYSANESDQPITVIDDDAFEAAGGEVAGRMDGADAAGVAAGSLSAGDAEINLIGSALPPAFQEYLHPFGMADHALSFMGHTMMCNALGFEQRRFVDGELVGTWGELR